MLSFIPSLRRVFQYHAAEHKAINAYEAGDELTPENAQRHSLIHPRCGTAFLLWVMVVGVFVYALLGRPVWYWLIISRIVLLPVIAGIAYELIRFAGKHSDEPHPDDAARAGPLAAAADDARADARPARGVDSAPAGSPRSRRPGTAGRPTSGGDGVVATERSASVVWQGDLMNGSGTIAEVPSGAFGPLDVSWASRAEEPNGKTSPEELIAAAWAACFAMALSNGLAKAGNAPEKLETSATVTFQPGEGIIKGALTVRGTVPGLDEAAFAEAAERREAELPGVEGALGDPRRQPRRDSSRANLRPRWPHSTISSRSSTAPTRRRRSACPTPRSTTTTARRPTSAGA